MKAIVRYNQKVYSVGLAVGEDNININELFNRVNEGRWPDECQPKDDIKENYELICFIENDSVVDPPRREGAPSNVYTRDTSIVEEIYEMLENAEENGYPVWDCSPESITEDLIEKTSIENDYTYEEIVSAVKTCLVKYHGWWK